MKKTYIISYDLKNANSDSYEKITEYIKSHGTWAHINESLWAIKTEKSAILIRDEFTDIVPNGSSVFIIKSGVEAAWFNVLCRNEWLKDNL